MDKKENLAKLTTIDALVAGSGEGIHAKAVPLKTVQPLVNDLRKIELGQTLTAREGWWTQARPCPTTPTVGHQHRNDGRDPE